MTIYSLDVLLFLFGTSLLFHVKALYLMVLFMVINVCRKSRKTDEKSTHRTTLPVKSQRERTKDS